MEQLRAAIIGCGGRGGAHAKGYAETPGVTVVAVSDPVMDAAAALGQTYKTPGVFQDHRELLEKVHPDIVSVCTWTGLHLPIVLDCVQSGVRAIHCEKPMAPTMGEARQMRQACEAAGVQLTFCHQRRFGAQFIKARELARSGAIGTVHRLEGFCANLFDWGTHWFDMFFFYNNEAPAEWVMGQIDLAQPRTVFGVPVESSGLSYVAFSNDVHALLATGAQHGGRCENRIIGSDGMIEVGPKDGPRLRMLRNSGSGWDILDLTSLHGNDTSLSVINAVECLRTGAEPELSVRKAYAATELIFATYESARRQAKVTLPLEIDDSPLIDLMNHKGISPK